MKKIYLIITFIMLFSLTACQRTATQQSRNFITFDTIIRVDAYGYSNTDYRAIFSEIQDVLDHIHIISTKYDLYDGVNNVKFLNENPGVAHEVDPILIDMINLSIDYYNLEGSQSKFNISIGKVLEVWSSYRDACLSLTSPVCEIPDIEELTTAAININPNNIIIDEEASTVLIPEGMKIDLGGIAKGYGAEKVGDILRTYDLRAFQVNAGGSNVEFYGEHPSVERNYWIGSLRDPFNPNSAYALVRVNSGENIVTSGDYERFFTVDGQNYHHLIDPDSLFPTWHIRAVTIISTDPTIGDIHSTIAFLLPLEDSIAFINSIEEVEAIWMDEDNKVHFSENFVERHLHQLMADTDYDISGMNIPEPLSATGLNPLTTTLFIMLGLIVGGFTIVIIREKKKANKNNESSQ